MEKGAFFENARGDLTGPLSGVKVIEATTTWAGPMVGCILGDLGAEVLKVEHPKGELSRSFRPQLPNSKLNVPHETCLLYTSPSPRDATLSRMPSSA